MLPTQNYTIILIQNMALMLSLTFVYTLFRQSIEKLPRTPSKLVKGTVFGVIAICGLLMPISIAPGFFFDIRPVVIAVIAAYEGTQISFIVLTIVLITRGIVGGVGFVSAIPLMTGVWLLGLIFHRFKLAVSPYYRTRNFILLGAVMAFTVLIISLFNPFHLSSSDAMTVAIQLMIMLLVGPPLMGTLLAQETVRSDNLRQLEIGNIALNASQEGVIVTNPIGNVIFNNPAATRLLLGANTDQSLINRSIYDFVMEPSRSFMLVLLEQKQGIDPALEVTGKRFDESIFPMTVAVAKLPDITVFTFHDLSESRAASQKSTIAEIEREKVRTIRNLISDLSHDLKTPVSAMKTSTYMLEKVTERILQKSVEVIGTPRPPELKDVNQLDTPNSLHALIPLLAKMRDHTSMLNQGLKRLQSLVDSLSDMGRLDSLPQFKFVPTDLGKLILAVVETRKPLMTAKMIDIQTKIPTIAAMIELDPDEFRRVLENLLDNAVQYTNSGKHIYIRGEIRATSAVVEIQDEGVGIPAEMIPHIFDRFYRGDPSRPTRSGGMGLGLAISKRIIEAHGGTISVDSIPDVGTTFRIFIPLVQPISDFIGDLQMRRPKNLP